MSDHTRQAFHIFLPLFFEVYFQCLEAQLRLFQYHWWVISDNCTTPLFRPFLGEYGCLFWFETTSLLLLLLLLEVPWLQLLKPCNLLSCSFSLLLSLFVFIFNLITHFVALPTFVVDAHNYHKPHWMYNRMRCQAIFFTKHISQTTPFRMSVKRIIWLIEGSTSFLKRFPLRQLSHILVPPIWNIETKQKVTHLS